jgi:hypothetical protein
MNKAPGKEGFFWGRWHTPAPGTADGGECCNPTIWEVHCVFRNHWRINHDDEFRVSVPGVEKSQPINGFEWGPEVPQYVPPQVAVRP